MASGVQKFCSKCGRTKSEDDFYLHKDGTRADLCKACQTMHINNWDPETFTWLLEEFDVPYIPAEWNVLRDRAYQKDPYKMTGMSVFGKYLSKMKLKQWKNYSWADTESLQKRAEEEAKLFGTPTEQQQEKILQMKEAYERGEISEAQFKTYAEINKPAETPVPTPPPPASVQTGSANSAPYPINSPYEQVELVDIGADLTKEDKVYLATRWGTLYTPADWVTLEERYSEYEQSFNLHNADLIAGTKQLCKLDLKSHQALDTGDIDTYSKLAKAADALRKSLKFTEAQRKEDKEAEFSCYGQIVAFCELHNDEDFIKPIDLSIDRDIVDRDIRDIKNYTRSLIEEDPAVFKMIEQYIKKRQALDEEKTDNANNDFELSDKDFIDYSDCIRRDRAIDNGEEEEEDE